MSKQFTNKSPNLSPGLSGSSRRGTIVVLTAILLVVLVGMLAFSIDVGYIVTAQTELQRSLDAAALAGAGAIASGTDEAEGVVRQYLAMNKVGNKAMEGANVTVQPGHWDTEARTFSASNDMPSAIKVHAEANNLPFFFGRIFRHTSFDLEGEAIAMYMPREIMIVLDYSGSMNDDSELKSIGRLPQSAIEANLLQIYKELGSPTFGNMQWTPQYISSTSTTTIKNTLGLNSLPYPYPSGSWNDYIDYVRNDGDINSAGYRKRYGYLTFINYLLEKQPKYSETPLLWQTSEQPITAVKDAVELYLAYLQEVETDDRVGLVIYTHPSSGAKLETGLTNDFSVVSTTARHRQAGHYDSQTNIGAGIKKAREELDARARKGAFKLIVLMTDGVANAPGSTSGARSFALSEAALCAAKKYPVVTIGLGTGADMGLMDQIATMTGGMTFPVPGGTTVAEYEKELRQVFRDIADHRPLRVVK